MKTLTTTIIVLAMALFSSCGDTTKLSTQSTSETTIEKETTVKRVLFVLTSHEDLGNTGNKTGFWLEEFSDPYYLLTDSGIEVSIASPKGGRPPMDPSSASKDYQTEGTKRFEDDTKLQELLSNTLKLETINATDYDAIYYPGGHGPLWDLAEDKNSIALIEAFFNANKPVSAACHAPAVFKNTKKQDGTPMVKGLRITGFSNSEETAAGLVEVVPFLVEDMLNENGAIYSKEADWAPYVIEDGSLITGQNPASAKLVAEKLLNRLK